MRKGIRKELIARFRAALKRRLPQFRRHTEKSNDPIWAWRLAPKLTFFLELQPFDKKDQFVLEIGWSENGKIPWPPPPRQSNPPDIEAARWRVRLARLWATGTCEDVWEIVPEKAERAERKARLEALDRGDVAAFMRETPEEDYLPRVAPLVEDAVQKLIDYGLPLFRKVAEHRGIPWPDHEVT